jgi:uncharacterized protein YbbK (DUF523 family)
MLISACLFGINCRYDNKNCYSNKVERYKSQNIIPVCPEQLGGLSTPREPCEIENGSGEDVLEGNTRVVGTVSGKDYSAEFIQGAEETLKIAKMFNCKKAIMKSKSPSCGCGKIYHRGKLSKGNGVTTALLLRNGIEIILI